MYSFFKTKSQKHNEELDRLAKEHGTKHAEAAKIFRKECKGDMSCIVVVELQNGKFQVREKCMDWLFIEFYYKHIDFHLDTFDTIKEAKSEIRKINKECVRDYNRKQQKEFKKEVK